MKSAFLVVIGSTLACASPLNIWKPSPSSFPPPTTSQTWIPRIIPYNGGQNIKYDGPADVDAYIGHPRFERGALGRRQGHGMVKRDPSLYAGDTERRTKWPTYIPIMIHMGPKKSGRGMLKRNTLSSIAVGEPYPDSLRYPMPRTRTRARGRRPIFTILPAELPQTTKIGKREVTNSSSSTGKDLHKRGWHKRVRMVMVHPGQPPQWEDDWYWVDEGEGDSGGGDDSWNNNLPTNYAEPDGAGDYDGEGNEWWYK